MVLSGRNRGRTRKLAGTLNELVSCGRFFILSCALGVSALPGSAHAQETGDGQSYVADGVDGLPGVYRVGIPGTAAPRGGGSLFLGYGYTEPQNGEADGHHRLSTTLAAGGALFPYLAGAVRVDLRHDVHGTDPMGGDSGTVIDVTPLLRTGFVAGSHLHLGAEARLFLSGATVSTGIASPIFDGRFLASYFAPQDWTFSLLAGGRMAQSGTIVSDSSMLRPGDRVVLGVSEFPAVLVGLAGMKAFGPATFFVEGTWDILVGDGAPRVSQSPLRVDLGARYRLLRGLDLQTIVEVSPGKRAPSLPGDPLVPIEPRFSAIMGVSVRLPELVAPAAQTHEEPAGPEEEQAVAEAPAEEVAPVAPQPPAPTATLRVSVVDNTGHPISDARVTVDLPATDQHPAQTLDVPLDSINVYVLPELPVGTVEISVEAELLKSHRQEVLLTQDAREPVEVKLRKAEGAGSQLRGLVRSYSGHGVEAAIRVEPGGHETTCSADGEFELDLPPGSYRVVIEAEGYVTQKRTLRVRKESVTVLNADLQAN